MPRVMTQYQAVTEKYGVEFEFRPFFAVEPLPIKEFRAQRLTLLDHTAIVFSSRHAIDAFFTIAEELKVKIPETMKYFCTKEETFLIIQSDTSSSDALTRLFDARKLKYHTGVFVKSVSQDMKDVDLSGYDMIVFYNPADVKSLYDNFPGFEQGNIHFVSYGKGVVKAMEEAGIRIDVKAPTPEAPSVAKAIELYLESLR